MKTFYMVLNENTGYTRKKHNSKTDAVAEAVRLKQLQQNDEFYVLKAVAKAVVPVEIVWLQEE